MLTYVRVGRSFTLVFYLITAKCNHKTLTSHKEAKARAAAMIQQAWLKHVTAQQAWPQHAMAQQLWLPRATNMAAPISYNAVPVRMLAAPL